MAQRKSPVGSTTGQSPGPWLDTTVSAPLLWSMEYIPQLSYINFPALAIVILSGPGTEVPGATVVPQDPAGNGEAWSAVSPPVVWSMLYPWMVEEFCTSSS